MRARFVGADGVSFFTEIDDAVGPIYLRPVYPDEAPGGSLTNEEPRTYSSLRIGVYRREHWSIPIGPLAVPTWYGCRLLDVVYRFEGYR